MMKKIAILGLMLLCIMSVTAWAAENPGSQTIGGTTAATLQVEDKLVAERNSKLPHVMVLYINNAKTDYNGEIDEKIMGRLKTIAANRWVLVAGAG